MSTQDQELSSEIISQEPFLFPTEEEGTHETQSQTYCESESLDLLGKETLNSLTLTKIISSFSINFLLPFLNGLMLGFGELVAHEVGLKWGWFGAKVYRPVVGYTQGKEAQKKTKLI